MQQTQRRILQLILSYENGISDKDIVETLKKNLHEVRFHLDELHRGGFIELFTSTTFDEDNGKSYLATSVTSRGHMVLKGQLSLKDRADSRANLQTYNVANYAPIGAQQIGNQNSADINQNIGADTSEVLQIIESLKHSIGVLPSDSQDVAIESLSVIEEEIKTPTKLSRFKTALIALWSISKDITTFANSVTALAQRFNIHLPR